MFEPVTEKKFVEDGCNYMNDEEILAFSKMCTPSEFDPSKIPGCIQNVSYGSLPSQILDIYKPMTGEGPFPVIFYIHGGGWILGTKTDAPLDGIIGLIDHGYIVLSVDYRLVQDGGVFPEFLFDAKTAIRWAREHADEYGFDPKRFGAVGDSAGGYITLMIGLTAGRPEYAGEIYGSAGYPDGVQAICDLYSPTVLFDPFVPFYLESGVKRAMHDIEGEPSLFDVAFGTDSEKLLSIFSPLDLVHKNIPPTKIMHGKDDGVIPYQHSVLLAEKIKQVCGEGQVDLTIYEGRNHGDYGFNTPENSLEIARFFDRYLK